MLGKAEYARLDALVAQLAQKTVDQEFFLYFLIIALVIIAAWWFARRSRKPAPTAEPKDTP